MSDSAFKTQVSRDENANSASNVLFIQVADNAGNVATITGGKLDVNAVVSPENVSVDDSAFAVAVDMVGAIGMLADEVAPDSVDEGDIVIPRMTLDRKQLMVLVDPTTDANRLVINADGSINVAFVGAGTTVNDYNTATVAGGGTSNHDYTVTATKTLTLRQIIFSASGKMKIELKTGPLATLVPRAVAFIDQDSFGELTFAQPILVPDTLTGTARIIRTNRQGGSQDVYTTINGSEA